MFCSTGKKNLYQRSIKIKFYYYSQYGHTRQNCSELNTDIQNKDLRHKRITDNFIVFNGTLKWTVSVFSVELSQKSFSVRDSFLFYGNVWVTWSNCLALDYLGTRADVFILNLLCSLSFSPFALRNFFL